VVLGDSKAYRIFNEEQASLERTSGCNMHMSHISHLDWLKLLKGLVIL